MRLVFRLIRWMLRLKGQYSVIIVAQDDRWFHVCRCNIQEPDVEQQLRKFVAILRLKTKQDETVSQAQQIVRNHARPD